MTVECSISLKEVSKKFDRNQPVISNLSLDIKAGEFVSLLGPSGCGKSTLLRMMAGLEVPSRGVISLSQGLSMKNLSYVFQDANLLPWRSVKDNILLPLTIKGYPFEKEVFENLVEKVNLKDAINKFPHELSGGMKMRVSIARALISNPKWLLLDEPFSALDDFSRQKLQDDLRNLWSERNLTIVFVTHSVSEALYLSTRILMLSQRPAKIIVDKGIEFTSQRNMLLKSSQEFNKEVKFFSLKYGDSYA